MRIRKLAITATLISVLALTGCGGSSNDGADGAKDQGSTNSKSGQTGSGETDEQADGDTSRDGSEQRTSGDGQTSTGEDDLDPSVVAYRKYRTVVDEMSASGGKETSKLNTVAIGDLLKENQALAKFYTAKKVHTEGSTRIVWVRKMSISSTALTLQACIDFSKVKTLDANGKSALKPGAPSRFLDTAQMRQVKNKWWRASVSRTRAQDC